MQMEKQELIEICIKLRDKVDEQTRKKFDEIIELAKKKKVDAEKAMSLTCWGSLVFCCATLTDVKKSLSSQGKKCLWRDAAIALMEMTEEDLCKIKSRWHAELVRNKKLR